MSEKSEASKQKLVVVGGGSAGMEFVSGLKGKTDAYDVTVLTSKDFVEKTPFMLKAFLIAEKSKELLVRWSDTTKAFPGVKFVHGFVSKVHSAENKVELADGTKIDYDKLVIATGSKYPTHPWQLRGKIDYAADEKAAAADKHAAVWKLVNRELGVSITPQVAALVLADAKAKSAVALVAQVLDIAKGSDVKLKSFKKAVSKLQDVIDAKLVKSLSAEVETFLSLEKDAEDKKAKAKALTKSAKKVIQGVAGVILQIFNDGLLMSDPSFVQTLEQRVQSLHSVADRIQAAQSIVIAGGGIVGIEMAAEIAVVFPTKSVTLIHLGDKLFDFTNSGRAQRYAKWFMDSHKVATILNDSVQKVTDNGSHYTVSTKGGTDVKADMVLTCTGGVPNTAFLAGDQTLAAALSPKGFVKVDKHFQVDGTNNIYCIGDVADSTEPKTGLVAMEHGKFLAKNFIEAANKSKLTQWVGYSAPKFMGGTLGPSEGLLLINGWCVSAGGLLAGLRPKLIKSQLTALGLSADHFDTDWNQFHKDLNLTLANKKESDK